jgi:hypothetical protein
MLLEVGTGRIACKGVKTVTPYTHILEVIDTTSEVRETMLDSQERGNHSKTPS